MPSGDQDGYRRRRLQKSEAIRPSPIAVVGWARGADGCALFGQRQIASRCGLGVALDDVVRARCAVGGQRLLPGDAAAAGGKMNPE